MLNLVFILIFLSIVFGAYRFIKGPSSSDRVVALDTLTTIVSVALVVGSLFFKNYILLDISFVFAALSFTSVIVIARYLEGGKS
ncbi:MAG TPA: monovalent cation/H+ antiporter complex subunit F [Halanaerobiales bacterium]|nr:monovalent cation/H+ antiporter complex subunit F [Halanaerobiales bacterium]